MTLSQSLAFSYATTASLYRPSASRARAYCEWIFGAVTCGNISLTFVLQNTHTHTRLTALFPGLPMWAGTRKVKTIWILLKQETASGSGISWALCKSAPRSRQITMPVPHHSSFYRPDALPATQPTASKHWRHNTQNIMSHLRSDISQNSVKTYVHRTGAIRLCSVKNNTEYQLLIIGPGSTYTAQKHQQTSGKKQDATVPQLLGWLTMVQQKQEIFKVKHSTFRRGSLFLLSTANLNPQSLPNIKHLFFVVTLMPKTDSIHLGI